MTDLEMFTAMLTRAHLTFERLDIYDGSVELSVEIEDMLNMGNVKVAFRFSKDGMLDWIDAECNN